MAVIGSTRQRCVAAINHALLIQYKNQIYDSERQVRLARHTKAGQLPALVTRRSWMLVIGFENSAGKLLAEQIIQIRC
jgi:hypothetical protein